jgi:hypothetical protein
MHISFGAMRNYIRSAADTISLRRQIKFNMSSRVIGNIPPLRDTRACFVSLLLGGRGPTGQTSLGGFAAQLLLLVPIFVRFICLNRQNLKVRGMPVLAKATYPLPVSLSPRTPLSFRLTPFWMGDYLTRGKRETSKGVGVPIPPTVLCG